MSVVTKSIVSADAQARYLSPSELDQIQDCVEGGEHRLHLAQVLTEHRQQILQQVQTQLFSQDSDGDITEEKVTDSKIQQACIDQLQNCLRQLTYALVAGDASVIAELSQPGDQNPAGVDSILTATLGKGLHSMKDIAISLFSGDEGIEVGPYFDSLIRSMG